jgi:hypothetical protein
MTTITPCLWFGTEAEVDRCRHLSARPGRA